MKINKIIAFDTIKFLLAICIVGHHIFCNSGIGKYFRSADLAVECFFVLSGFFIARHFYCLKSMTNLNKSDEFFDYFVNKIKILYPTFLFCGLLNFLLRNVFGHISSKTFMLNIVLMGDWGGVMSIVSGVWYLVVYFWLSLFLYYLLLYYEDKAKVFYVPFLTIICLFYFINNGNHIYGHSAPVIFHLLSLGTVRGLLGLCCGIIVYEICSLIENKKIDVQIKYLSCIMLVLEILFSVLIFKHIVIKRSHSVSDFNIYFYFGYIISLIYFKREIFLKFLNLKMWNKINYISYTLYLSHFFIVEVILRKYILNLGLNSFCLYLFVIILCILFAYVCYFCQNKFYYFLKNFFIINNTSNNEAE